jgi:hypothetical protein
LEKSRRSEAPHNAGNIKETNPDTSSGRSTEEYKEYNREYENEN